MNNDIRTQICDDDAQWGDLGHESEESQRDYEQQIHNHVELYPGCAQQVYSGWVWVTEIEHSWSKRPTRESCERVVYEVVERLGVDEAFDLTGATHEHL